jgi:tetrapyrrole methylase family protein/MazG family protein
LAKVIRLVAGPISDEFTLSLKGHSIYLSQNHPHLVSKLSEHAIEFALLNDDDLPDNATLILVPGPFDELIQVVDRLLGPGGCPWDQAQTHETLKKYLLEEAYEVIDAIDSGDQSAMCEELGDLLLQPVMHGQISKAQGGFQTNDSARAIVEKLIRRHPHVFGDVNVADADEVLRNWDKIKQTEKSEVPQSILAGVPKGMASLLRAHEVSKRAARVGFEWPDIEAVFDKLREEELELKEALGTGTQNEIESELGDMLFTVVNIARWAKVEPEEALRTMVNRFTNRFMRMEAITEKDLKSLTSEEWNDLWVRAKAEVG